MTPRARVVLAEANGYLHDAQFEADRDHTAKATVCSAKAIVAAIAESTELILAEIKEARGA